LKQTHISDISTLCYGLRFENKWFLLEALSLLLNSKMLFLSMTADTF